MKRKTYSKSKKAAIMREHEDGHPLNYLAKKHGIPLATLYGWRYQMEKEKAKIKKENEEDNVEPLAYAGLTDGALWVKKANKNPLTDESADAPRKYKGIALQFNKYEFDSLNEAATKAGTGKYKFIREAIKRHIESPDQARAVIVNLPDDDKKLLSDLCAESNIRVHDFVRNAVNDAIHKKSDSYSELKQENEKLKRLYLKFSLAMID